MAAPDSSEIVVEVEARGPRRFEERIWLNSWLGLAAREQFVSELDCPHIACFSLPLEVADSVLRGWAQQLRQLDVGLAERARVQAQNRLRQWEHGEPADLWKLAHLLATAPLDLNSAWGSNYLQTLPSASAKLLLADLEFVLRSPVAPDLLASRYEAAGPPEDTGRASQEAAQQATDKNQAGEKVLWLDADFGDSAWALVTWDAAYSSGPLSMVWPLAAHRLRIRARNAGMLLTPRRDGLRIFGNGIGLLQFLVHVHDELDGLHASALTQTDLKLAHLSPCAGAGSPEEVHAVVSRQRRRTIVMGRQVALQPSGEHSFSLTLIDPKNHRSLPTPPLRARPPIEEETFRF